MPNMADESETPHTHIRDRYDENAPAAVLTKAQREYLLGERALEGSSERAVQRRIRRRIRAALNDIFLITRAYPESEMQKARADDGERVPPREALAGLLYRLQPENAGLRSDLTGESDSHEQNRDRRAAWAESDIERGIESVIHVSEQVDVDVDASIMVERGVDLEQLADRDPEHLSSEQLDRLLIHDLIPPEEYASIMKRRLVGDVV